MFPLRVQDAVGNTRTAAMDYRVLIPTLVTDENENRSATAFDVMGLVSGTATMGKITENLGDTLNNFRPVLSQDEIDQFFASPTIAAGAALLGDATTRGIYDYDRWRRDKSSQMPVYTATISRETHVSDPAPPDGLTVQLSFVHSDGFGRAIQTKSYAEPGPLVEQGPVVGRERVDCFQQ